MNKRGGTSESKDKGERPTSELTRRELLRRGVVMGGALLLSEHLVQGHAANSQRPRQAPAPLRFRGINYDTGTNYDASYALVTRTIWERALLERDLQAIREGLHCNTVTIYGTDTARLAEASEVALEQGLEVWLQPRLMEASPKDRLEHLAEVAREAEILRRHYGKVTLNVGVELSLFMSGIIPGVTFWERMAVLGDPTKRDIPTYTRKLDEHLGVACAVARARFGGPLTYSAGEWERISWTPFDVVGLSFYRSARNEATYVETLRRVQKSVRASGKPVVITEFGCCTFEGAGDLGAMGWSIVDYSKAVPEIPGEYVRSEQEQADYLVKLLGTYQAEGLDGAFIYDFSTPLSPYSSDPRDDLDMASFAVVKSVLEAGEREATRWEPKRAFHEVADVYAALESS